MPQTLARRQLQAPFGELAGEGRAERALDVGKQGAPTPFGVATRADADKEANRFRRSVHFVGDQTARCELFLPRIFLLAVAGALHDAETRKLAKVSRSEDRAESGRLGAALFAVAVVAIGALFAAVAVILLGGLMVGATHASSWSAAFRSALNGNRQLVAIAAFLGTYLVIAIGKLPGFQLDRTGAALLGASAMVGAGVLSLDQAYASIDFDTITLLLGAMIVVANLRLSGFFGLVSARAVARTRHPATLLTAIVAVTGLFSAFLVNDTICLVMTPLVLDLAFRLKRDPVPYALAVPLASNVGSVATITGNPQNMMIGSFSHIPYGAFVGALWPVAVIGLCLTVLLIVLAYRDEFLTGARLGDVSVRAKRYHPALAWKSVAVTLAMMALFFAGQPIAKVAIVAGAFLLLTRKVKAEKVYREIDWPLLLMFVGLFIVVAGLEKAILTREAMNVVGRLDFESAPILSFITAGLSNIVSNVPAVLLLKPFIANTSDQQQSWLVVAMASTLAGNLTLVGSVANLIVAQRAKVEGVDIDFWTHLKIGAPLTLMTIAFGAWWLGR